MYYKTTLSAVFYCILSIFAYGDCSSCDLSCKGVSCTVNQIMAEQPDSVFRFDEERMYLMPDRIIPTSKGLFLCNEQSSIFLPALFGDQKGIYIPCVRKLRMMCANDNCGYCCWDAYADGIECPRCGYPGDPA